MEFRPIRLLLGLLVALVSHNPAMAQLTVTVNAPASVIVSNTIAYTITVRSQGELLPNVEVSSTYSPSLEFVSATENQNVSFTRSGNNVRFIVLQLVPNSSQVINLTVRAPQVGTVTNGVVASVGQLEARANVSTTVTEVPGTADVAVSIVTPPSPIIVNDWVAFSVTLLNRGGGTVSGIFLTNTFTNGAVQVKSFRPSIGGSVAQNPPRVIFNVGSLAAGQSTNYQITIQPTIATNVILTSRFRSSGNADTNAANNIASASIAVLRPGTNQLTAQLASEQLFNPQNALMEQRVLLSNTGSNAAPSARVMLSNINYRVVNAIGTNNGHPFVLHPATLGPTQSLELLMEYFIPSREPGVPPQLIAYSVGEAAPLPSATGTGIEIMNIVWRRPAGAMTESNLVLEFPSTPRAIYEVQYSGSPEFTNALRALPPLVAQANRTVWVDYGPPKTVSRPRLGPTITETNVVVTNSFVTTNEMVLTNTVFVTNDMVVTTNLVVSTNMVPTTNSVVSTNQISITNLNMRFYRAIQLP